jgi:hypothetical protein
MQKDCVSVSSLVRFLPKLQLAKANEDINNGNENNDDDDDDNYRNCGRTKVTDKQRKNMNSYSVWTADKCIWGVEERIQRRKKC